MIIIKKSTKTFFRTVYISSVVVFCLTAGFYGCAKAYEGIRRIAFGEYRSAIEYKEGKLEFFDFELPLDFRNIFN